MTTAPSATAAASTTIRRSPLAMLRDRIRASAGRAIDLSSSFPPSTKDVRASNVFLTPFSRWVWRVATYRITRAGHWFCGLTFFLALFGAVSLEIQTYIPFLYTFAFWLVASAYAVFSRPRVQIKTRHAGSITAGATLQVDVEVTSLRRRGLLPAVDLNVLPILLPPAIDAVPGSGAPVPALQPGQSARVRLGLLCKQRGVYALKGYRVETDFPLGLINAYQMFKQENGLIVYPTFHPLSHVSLPTGAHYQPGGVALSSHRGDSFEFLGNREFRDGDNIRDIDWRATARQPFGSAPIVREWREEFLFRVGVVLDTHIPRKVRTRERTARKEAFERAVSVCAGIGDYLARSGYLVDIFAAGPTLYHLTTGQGAAYQEQILDILAAVEPASDEPFDTVESELLAVMDKLTTVICVFLSYDARRQEFVRMLREYGMGVKVILTPPEAFGTTAMASGVSPELAGEDVVVIDAATFAAGGPAEI